MKHELKIWPKYYCRVRSGEKTFEVRDNDRDFQRGDIVVLSLTKTIPNPSRENAGVAGFKLPPPTPNIGRL